MEIDNPNTSRSDSVSDIDLQELLQRLWAIKTTKEPFCSISADECINVAEYASEVFASQETLVEIPVPVTVCGDTHGQFMDLLRILTTGGVPPQTTYVFLGDYVDRGKNSIEVLIVLFIYKILFPTQMYMIRGNHEEARVNSTYGFLSECINRYGFEVYTAFNNSFNNMPVAAIIGQRIFCCHGGIVKDLDSLQAIADIARPVKQPNENAIMSQLTWSDPNRDSDGWTESARGVGFMFGKTPLWQFLEKFDLDLLARAHEVVQDGYEFFGMRRCVTIFSAPKYCDQFDNAGGMMRVSSDLTCSFIIIRPINSEFPLTRVEYHAFAVAPVEVDACGRDGSLTTSGPNWVSAVAEGRALPLHSSILHIEAKNLPTESKNLPIRAYTLGQQLFNVTRKKKKKSPPARQQASETKRQYLSWLSPSENHAFAQTKNMTI
ncbi:serine/threonine-protein phosphatase PP1 [Galendromus occidentalis]|uniref:Serine/threonine-protein phosphatase n=1 Tax=Galendromus occidentalis TaxID=34638 RepID=A0AAJ6QWY6_9ACAR|nr:serine/threonine-protein phosphatase PP1 [Galendromus occidentalis]